MEISYIVLGLAILLSLVSGFLLGKLYMSKELMLLRVSNQQKEEELLGRSVSLQQIQKEKDELFSRALVFETQLKSANEQLQAAKADAERINKQLQLEFAAIAQKVLAENAKDLTNKNEEKLGEILKPLKLEIGEFKKKVEETYDKESKERFSLSKEIDRLVKMSEQVSQEANNLTTALKGNTKMQGNWGELLLESILENSGLTKGQEFVTQEFIRDAAGHVIKDDEGRGLQPDVMVYYPDKRKIIIDSKVSLIAWERFVSEELADDDREKALQQHIQSIRNHIDGLSKKNYPKYAEALDYVLMFVPIEPAFLEALKKDRQLWKYAYDKNILLVSPTNLLAVLRIIADLWKVEQRSKNAIEIAEKAGSLYDKFVGFMDSLEAVGKKIADAQSSYEKAMGQLSTGKGNIVGRIEELKKMGANAQKQLPDKILYKLSDDLES